MWCYFDARTLACQLGKLSRVGNDGRGIKLTWHLAACFL